MAKVVPEMVVREIARLVEAGDFATIEQAVADLTTLAESAEQRAWLKDMGQDLAQLRELVGEAEATQELAAAGLLTAPSKE